MINWFQISPPTYPKSEYGLAFLARALADRNNHLLLLHEWLFKSGSICLPWALLCLCNLDAVLMHSGPFVVLNSLQLEGCASNDVQWSPIPLFASSLVSHKRSLPLAAHFPEPCHFLFSLLHIPDLLSIFLCVAFLPAATCCETNSLKYGRKFPIAKVRLLTLTWTWKRTKDESSRRQVLTCGHLQCVKSGLHSCAFAKYEHASRACGHVNWIRPMSFQHATDVGVCGNLHP